MNPSSISSISRLSVFLLYAWNLYCTPSYIAEKTVLYNSDRG